MTFSIAGKTAIVTGAANGVGLAIARHFLEAGANVMLADMDEKRLKAEIGKTDTDASSARIFGGDLREKLTQANLLSATIDAFERVDILVNACRQVMASDPLDGSDDSMEVLLQQNLLANLRLTQLVVKRMIAQSEEEGDDEQGVGSIVNLSSVAGQRTRPDLMAYSVSCAALDQLTRSLAVALAPQRIRVNGIAFGSVMSASLQKALRDDRNLRDAICDATPLGRIAPASEVAEVAQFLASDSARFVTGEVLKVDGGRSILDAVVASAH